MRPIQTPFVPLVTLAAAVKDARPLTGSAPLPARTDRATVGLVP